MDMCTLMGLGGAFGGGGLTPGGGKGGGGGIQYVKLLGSTALLPISFSTWRPCQCAAMSLFEALDLVHQGSGGLLPAVTCVCHVRQAPTDRFVGKITMTTHRLMKVNNSMPACQTAE